MKFDPDADFVPRRIAGLVGKGLTSVSKGGSIVAEYHFSGLHQNGSNFFLVKSRIEGVQGNLQARRDVHLPLLVATFDPLSHVTTKADKICAPAASLLKNGAGVVLDAQLEELGGAGKLEQVFVVDALAGHFRFPEYLSAGVGRVRSGQTWEVCS